MASAANPLGRGDDGWGVKLPNSSAPLLITPFWFRSRTSQALFAFAVHAICIGIPVFAISNCTPCTASVRKKPSPVRSMMMGLQSLGSVLSPVWSDLKWLPGGTVHDGGGGGGGGGLQPCGSSDRKRRVVFPEQSPPCISLCIKRLKKSARD